MDDGGSVTAFQGLQCRSRNRCIYEIVELPMQRPPREFRVNIAMQKQIENKPILKCRGTTRWLEPPNTVVYRRSSKPPWR